MIALVADLMVAVRIEEAAKQVGATVVAVDSVDELRNELGEASLIVADLATPGIDVEGVAIAAGEAGVSLIGFYPHVDIGLGQAAKRAGVTRVYPRSRFLAGLHTILREGLDA